MSVQGGCQVVCRSITFQGLRSSRTCRCYMPFAHTHCKETEGWQSRLGSKTGIAGGRGRPLHPTLLDPFLPADASHMMQHLEAVPLAVYSLLRRASLLQLTQLAQESAVWYVLGDFQVRMLAAVQLAEVQHVVSLTICCCCRPPRNHTIAEMCRQSCQQHCRRRSDRVHSGWGAA